MEGLVLTPTHACLANIFSRMFKKGWPPGMHVWFVLGAVLPDMPMLVVGSTELLRRAAHDTLARNWDWIRGGVSALVYQNGALLVADKLWINVGPHGATVWLNQCFHSVFFWIAILVAARRLCRLRQRLTVLACGAIFFHILVDWPTHAANAHNYLWPVFSYPLPGIISYANPLLLKIESGIGAIWLASWIFRLTKKMAGAKKS